MNESVLMRHCIELAKRGKGSVSPNPMVGCLLVKNGIILAEGYHAKFGGPHAEILAIRKAGKSARGATLIANLEPCAHHGKTPPCTESIIKAGIKKVIVASRDPNPLVMGAGIRKLRKYGISVKVGVQQKEAELLNESFFKYMSTGMPFVGIKTAQTLDAKISDISGNSKWITSEAARKEAHRIRSEYDAILVGAVTVERDNPELTVRSAKGRNPVRIIIDGRLSLPVNRKIFNTDKAPAWLLTSASAIKKNKIKLNKLMSKGVRVFCVSSFENIEPESVLHTLAGEGISSLLIEGGSVTAAPFIEKGLADVLHIFISSKILGKGHDAFMLESSRSLNRAVKLSIAGISLFKNDLYIRAKFD